MVKRICRHCGDEFEGRNEQFCDNKCRDAHIVKLEKIVIDAVENDPNHTKKMSE